MDNFQKNFFRSHGISYFQYYFANIRKNLIRDFGNCCKFCGVNDMNELQFAHRVQYKVNNGYGRGRQQRYESIRKHPERFILLCKICHKVYDDGKADEVR